MKVLTVNGATAGEDVFVRNEMLKNMEQQRKSDVMPYNYLLGNLDRIAPSSKG